MVTLRRQHIEVGSDRRKNTRIEFHNPVVILGIDESAQIIDFSTEGFYIELKANKDIVIGQSINLALRLPNEKESLRVKAKIAYKDSRGVGCSFVDLTPSAAEKIERCFNIFNATLPIE